jgi:hypothetical protein
MLGRRKEIRRFMQTLTFLWFELKAARRHVKEAVAECEELGKADFSLLKKALHSELIEQRPSAAKSSIVEPDDRERCGARRRTLLARPLSARVR